MNDVKLFRFGDRYHLWLKGEWHNHRSWEEVRLLLVYNGFDPWDVLASATVLGQALDIEYRPCGRHRWWVDGKPQPANIVRLMLKEQGCSKEQVDTILRGNKLCGEIEAVRDRIRQESKRIEEEFVVWLESVLSKKSGSARKGLTSVE